MSCTRSPFKPNECVYEVAKYIRKLEFKKKEFPQKNKKWKLSKLSLYGPRGTSGFSIANQLSWEICDCKAQVKTSPLQICFYERILGYKL